MRFVFVGGSARSGTSLVQKLLVCHSQVAGGPEFDHTEAIFSLYREMATPWRLRRHVRYYDETSLAAAFRGFYEGFFDQLRAAKPAAGIVSEKTPSNMLVADILLRVWPDAYFVAVVRDGRDVWLSHRDVNRRYRRRGERNPERDVFLRTCRTWNTFADRYFAVAEHPELRERLLLVRFEELVSSPATQVAALCHRLGIPVEQRQLAPELITEQETGVELEGAYFTQDMYRQPFNTDKVARWRREMNPAMRAAATMLMRRNLARFGYPT